jgi:polyphosphate kinase
MASGQEQFDPRHFLNRELSWLEFNQRVLDEACDPANPLLERVKFFCIFGSNLDEFFEVRVAGIKQQMESDVAERSVDGLTPGECFQAVTRRVRRMVEDQYRCWREELTPALERAGIRFLKFEQLDAAGRQWVERFYHSQVRPVLTPLGIDPAHPFPQLLNKSLNLIVRLEITQRGVTQRRLAVVQVPRILPRLVQLPAPAGRRHYLLLGRLIGAYLGDLFPGTRLLGHWLFRVTRNSELYIDEEESGNLLKAVENEVHNRRKGAAVRLEVAHDCPADIREVLLETLGLTAADLYAIEGPINPARLMTLCDGEHPPELRDPPFLAPVATPLREATDLFAVVRERDVLLHHPYENFSSVVDFLQQAATDPAVLAIKQTLYRTGGDRRIIGALMEAVKNGKQVTAVVELKARFDEANNIQWARQLEEAGVHVVYGLVGYKIHGKLCLVVRHEGDAIRRYVHLGTGNYNPATARIYTDLGLLTARPDLAAEVGDLFNLLTGICQFQGTQKLLVAPFNLHERMSDLILRETASARAGLPARIIAKMNSLVDPGIIQALYRASQAGVKIDLIVRGICCLRPGVKGLSETITVRSIVGRFLEHSRIFYFENACQPEVFLGSADWMPRNFFRRIEVVFPVEDGNLRERVINEILALNLADNVKARTLDARGRWHRVQPPPGGAPVNCQEELMRRALGAPGAAAAKTARKYPRVGLRPRPAV